MKKDNVTILEYYKSLSKKISDNKIIPIIDAICMSHYPEPDAEFGKQVIEFVEFFKNENKKYFAENQDSIIFRMYTDIIKKSISENKVKIEKALTNKQKNYASGFAKEILSTNTQLVCVASANMRTYMNIINNEEDLKIILEYLLYSKNGILLFHTQNETNRTLTFGFLLNNNSFIEIKDSELRNFSKNKQTIYTTFSKFKENITWHLYYDMI